MDRVGVSLVGTAWADEYVRTQTIPVMLDPEGKPVKRNFVHVQDLVSAILLALDNPRVRQETFNICMDGAGGLWRGRVVSPCDAPLAERRNQDPVRFHMAR